MCKIIEIIGKNAARFEWGHNTIIGKPIQLLFYATTIYKLWDAQIWLCILGVFAVIFLSIAVTLIADYTGFRQAYQIMWHKYVIKEIKR